MNNSLETKLSIVNIKVKAHHGWYESERKIGGMYNVSVHLFQQIEVDLDLSEINNSVNYEHIEVIVREVMKNEYKLIEHCCQVIFKKLKKIKPEAIWLVELVKLDVPIKHVEQTSFAIKG
jgi:7,8-dihydroneopterin aldolase/epimerase/oxygenase